jgi:membrane-associated phospholipid phosphatase
VLSFAVGMLCAQTTRAFGQWNNGYQWERDLMVAVHPPLPRALDMLMMVAPWFGTNISLIPFILLICLWLWFKVKAKDNAIRLGVVQLGSYLLNPSLKALYDRTRPDMFQRRGWYGWSSYPSGHTIASVSVLLTLAIILKREKGWTWPFYFLVPIMFASMYSRIYLAVHWPTDVIAGAVVGVVWLGATMYAYRGMGAKPS